VPAGASPVSAASAETGRRETDAEEVRARRDVSTVEAPAISLRRFHVANQVSLAPCFHLFHRTAGFRSVGASHHT